MLKQIHIEKSSMREEKSQMQAQKNKTATEQQVDEAADALLKSITVE